MNRRGAEAQPRRIWPNSLGSAVRRYSSGNGLGMTARRNVRPQLTATTSPALAGKPRRLECAHACHHNRLLGRPVTCPPVRMAVTGEAHSTHGAAAHCRWQRRGVAFRLGEAGQPSGASVRRGTRIPALQRFRSILDATRRAFARFRRG